MEQMKKEDADGIVLAPERAIEIPFSFDWTGDGRMSCMSLAHMFVGRLISPRVLCSSGFAVTEIQIVDNSLERAVVVAPWITSISAVVVRVGEDGMYTKQEGKLIVSGMMHR